MIDPGLTVDVDLAGRESAGTITTRGITWRYVIAGGKTWFRGQNLWRATLPPTLAARFGDGWVEVGDIGAGFGLAGPLVHLRDEIQVEIFGPHAGLRDAGRATVGGRAARELRTAKDIYDVAASGTPYGLRWLDQDIPGAGGQPCGIVLDHFGEVPAPKAPTPVVGILAAGTVPAPSPTAIVAG